MHVHPFPGPELTIELIPHVSVKRTTQEPECTDPMVVQSSPILLRAAYNEAWMQPDELLIKHISGPSMQVNSTRYVHVMRRNNSTWNGMIEKTVAFPDVGTVYVEYIVNIRAMVYVKMFTMCVISDSGTNKNTHLISMTAGR